MKSQRRIISLCEHCKPLEKRVAELEKLVRELQAQPREYHYHAAPAYTPPAFTPPPTRYIPPSSPYIGDPVPLTPTVPGWGTCDPPYVITCSSGGNQ